MRRLRARSGSMCCGRRGLRKSPAFTLVEGLLVAAVVVLLVVFVAIPAAMQQARQANRIHCVSHLKNIGLSFRTAAVDGGDFVFRLPVNKGGTLPWAESPADAWRHFAALSNELSTPKILACPKDVRGATSNTWSSVALKDRNRALSYTLGLDAREDFPQTILGSDRNLTLDGLPVGMSVLRLTAGAPLGFDTSLHNRAGNLLLGDGSVRQVTEVALLSQLADTFKETYTNGLRILVP